MDEHRIGLKPIVRGVWAPVGERPIALCHHRFEWLYVTGFVEQGGPVRKVVGIRSGIISEQTNYTILCGEIKLLIDGFCGEGLPAIDFAHVGLAGSKQRPEQHGGRVRRRQYSLRFDPALELLV